MRKTTGNFIPVRRKSVYVPPSIRDGYEVRDGEPEPVMLGRYMIYIAGCGDGNIWLYWVIGVNPGRGLLTALADWNRGIAWEILPMTSHQLREAKSNIAWRRATHESVKPRSTPRNSDPG